MNDKNFAPHAGAWIENDTIATLYSILTVTVLEIFNDLSEVDISIHFGHKVAEIPNG